MVNSVSCCHILLRFTARRKKPGLITFSAVIPTAVRFASREERRSSVMPSAQDGFVLVSGGIRACGDILREVPVRPVCRCASAARRKSPCISYPENQARSPVFSSSVDEYVFYTDRVTIESHYFPFKYNIHCNN